MFQRCDMSNSSQIKVFDRTMSINMRGINFTCKYATKQFFSRAEPASDMSEEAQSHPVTGMIITLLQ